MEKGFWDYFQLLNADFFCLQETKMQPHQMEVELPGYHQYWYSAEKKGYSGTAVFAKQEPLTVTYGLGVEELDHEGRIITLEYPDFYVVTNYTPNAQEGLKRLDFRMAWDDAYLSLIHILNSPFRMRGCPILQIAPVPICSPVSRQNLQITVR